MKTKVYYVFISHCVGVKSKNYCAQDKTCFYKHASNNFKICLSLCYLISSDHIPFTAAKWKLKEIRPTRLAAMETAFTKH